MMHTPTGVMPPQLPRDLWAASWRVKLPFLASRRRLYITLALQAPWWSAQRHWWWRQMEATERDMLRLLSGDWTCRTGEWQRRRTPPGRSV